MEDRKEDGARDEVGNANSCSSSGSDNDVDMLHMADESVLDGEVSKRLNQMVPVRVSVSIVLSILSPFIV